MFWYPLILGATLLVALVFLAVGRMAVIAFRIDALDGDEPEHWLAALVLGTGLTTVLCGWFAYAGMAAIHYRWCLLVIFLALLTAVWRRRRLASVFSVCSSRWSVLVGAIVVFRLGLYLLPLLGRGSHQFFSDAAVYTAAADYLARNGFSASIEHDPHDLIQSLMFGFQQLSHRMGPMFLHSLLTVCVPELGAFELLAVVMGLGAMLNLAAVFLLCRWCFAIEMRVATAGLALIAIQIHTLGLSCGAGFLCQVYGTAVLGTAVACMGLLGDSNRWTHGNALLVGCLIAFQMSMYSELMPVLALAGVAWLAVVARTAFRAGVQARLGRFLCVALLSMAIVANVEIIRCWRGVLVMMQVHGVGSHIPWGTVQFTEFALGSLGFESALGVSFSAVKRAICTPVAVLLFAAGVWPMTRGRGVFAGIALAVLVGLFVFYSCFRNDPWTGEMGHSWNLYKICKWAYPFVAAVQIAGLACWVRTCRCPRLAVFGGIALLGLVGLVNLYQQQLGARPFGYHNTFQIAGNEAPCSAARRARDRLSELDGPIFVVRAPIAQSADYLIADLLYPRTAVNFWPANIREADTLHALEPALPSNAHLLCFGMPPFDEPLEQLPFNIARLDRGQPTLFRLDSPGQMNRHARLRIVPLSEQPTTCWVFAPRAGPAVLKLEMANGTPASEVSVEIAFNDQAATPALLRDLMGPGLRVQLKSGVNRLTISVAGGTIRASAIRVQ